MGGFGTNHLTLIRVSFLGVPFGVGGKTRLKPVKTKLETWNWYVSTHTYLVSEKILFSTKTFSILLISAFFFAKNQHFLTKIVPLLEAIVWIMRYRFFRSVFSFCKIKGCYYWKCRFYRSCVRNSALRGL